MEAIRPKVPSNGVFEGSLVRGLSLTDYVEAMQKEVSLFNGVCGGNPVRRFSLTVCKGSLGRCFQ